MPQRVRYRKTARPAALAPGPGGCDWNGRRLRLPEELYAAVKQRAQSVGIPYQRFIRMAIENALQAPQSPK